MLGGLWGALGIGFLLAIFQGIMGQEAWIACYAGDKWISAKLSIPFGMSGLLALFLSFLRLHSRYNPKKARIVETEHEVPSMHARSYSKNRFCTICGADVTEGQIHDAAQHLKHSLSKNLK